MEYININNKEYKFIIGNADDGKYRKSLNSLTEKTFSFHFEQWYQNGYWKDQYIPYSLLDGDEVVSNVSVSTMDMEVLGETKRLIQLGTVMTKEEYRNQGLLRVLLDKVIAEWKAKGEYIYLFANDSVLDFYPKFGFHKVNQYQCSKAIGKKEKERCATKLNMSEKGNRDFVYNKENTPGFSAKIKMIGNAELVMFYCISIMKDSVYYIEEYDTVVVANYNQDLLEVYGVFGTEEASLDTILDYLVQDNTNRVKLYFTPNVTDSYTITPIEEEDTLFILGEDSMLLDRKQMMFPSLSHT